MLTKYWGLTPIDWAAVALYIAAMLVLGMWFAQRQKTVAHYFTADRRIPGWAAGLSLFSTLLSSFVFIAFPGQTYARDWQVLIQQFSTPLIVLGVAVFAIPVYRRVVRVSAYEYLERRYGFAGRVYGTFGFLADHFAKMGVVLSTMALAIHGITGLDQMTIIVVLGIVTVLYTMVGGIEGVIWTDVVQGLLMMACSVFVVVFILFFAAPEGPGAVAAASFTAEKMRFFDFGLSLTDETFYVILWSGVFHFLIRFMADQTMVQRYLTAPTLREARKGAAISIAACMVVWITFSLIGTLLYGFYQLHPDRLPETIVRADAVFPHFITTELPPGIVGIILVGLVAASMSTLSSELNSFGAVVASDIYSRVTHSETEAARMRISRIVVTAFGAAAILLALWISTHEEGILRLMLTIFNWMGATFGGGMLAMFLLGFFSPRTHRKGMYPALVLGLCFALWCAATSKNWITLPEPIAFLGYRGHEWWLIGLSTGLIAAAAYILSRILAPDERAPHELTAYAKGDDATA